jgi:hypothetical protein
LTVPPSRTARIGAAIAIGLVGATLAYVQLRSQPVAVYAHDFTWPWRAARALLQGKNPYVLIRPSGPFPFDAPFKYPLPAALVALPVAWLPPAVASAMFGGVSLALLAFGLSASSWGRLYLLLSPALLLTLFYGQWSTLMMAAALLPGISWAAVCKPTVGLAVFAYRPNRWAVIGGVLLILASFALVPSWFGDWLKALRSDQLGRTYMPPALLWGGPLLLLVLLRWRRPEARYLAVIAVMPQVMTFYTGFLFTLAAETKNEARLLAASTLIAFVGFDATFAKPSPQAAMPVLAGYWMLVFMMAPAVIMVLRRPNEGPMSSTAGDLPSTGRPSPEAATLS